MFDTRYLRCKCRSYKLRLPYIFGSLGIENSIVVIDIGIQVQQYYSTIQSTLDTLLKFDTDTVWCHDTSISMPFDPALLVMQFDGRL